VATKSPAERQKLRRIREGLGLTRANVWAPPVFLEYLISIGSIAPAQTNDPDALGDAIMEWAAIMQAVDIRS
jgi:hypothetical protein